MSHFTVAVFSKERLTNKGLEKKMIPYIESLTELGYSEIQDVIMGERVDESGAIRKRGEPNREMYQRLFGEYEYISGTSRRRTTKIICDILEIDVVNDNPCETLVKKGILEFRTEDLEEEFNTKTETKFFKGKKLKSNSKFYDYWDKRFKVDFESQDDAEKVRAKQPYDNGLRTNHENGDVKTYTVSVYDGYTMIELPVRDLYPSFADYLKEHYTYLYYNGIYKAWGSYSIVNQVWDWYVVGGRWGGMLPVDIKTATDPIKVDSMVRNNPFGFGSGKYYEDRADGAYLKDIKLDEHLEKIKLRIQKAKDLLQIAPEEGTEERKEWNRKVIDHFGFKIRRCYI